MKNKADQWEALLSLIPADIDKLAVESGALKRRRSIKDGQTLLRLLFVYCLTDFSFRQTAAWASQSALAQTSDVNLIGRFLNSELFLEKLIASMLKAPHSNITLVDATTVGGHWRLHLSWSQGQFSQLFVEDINMSESLTRFTLAPGQGTIVDRGYGWRKEIASVIKQQAHIVSRIKWSGLPVVDQAGKHLNLLEQAKTGQVVSLPVQTVAEGSIAAVCGRVIIAPKPEEALEKAIKKVKRRSQKRQSRIRQNTLKASQYLFLFTDEMSLPPEEIVALYRFRWQIELVFKRLKSIQGLDTMQVKNPKLCRVFILCHCLAALLIEQIISQLPGVFSPSLLTESILMAALSVYLPHAQSNLHATQLSS